VRILVNAVHPDDETLGCGGTILKHSMRGDAVSWMVITQASAPNWPAAEVEEKRAEIERVAARYQVKSFHWPGFPSTGLDSVPQRQIVDAVAGVIAEVDPEILYLINRGDVHTDHGVVFQATMAACKPFRTHIKRMLAYETISSTDAAPQLPERAFLPTVFSDITPHLEEKLVIMNEYRTEVQPYPLPRSPESIRALARVRGATIGVEYAEAFMLLREVW
jgi:N-acetylglucosamine malate deacetylase 1